MCISAFGLGSSLDFLFLVCSQNGAKREVVSPILFLVRSSQGCIPCLLVRAAFMMKISRAMEKNMY